MKIYGPKAFLQIEGFVVLVATCVAYKALGASWGKFVLLFLVPDVSMIGYIGGKTAGAWLYNAVHSYLGPALLWVVAHWGDQPALVPICLIWAAHIGFDRLLGYGLKFPSGFKDTHLNRL